MSSSAVTSRAKCTGCRKFGDATSVPSRIREVTVAAAVSVGTASNHGPSTRFAPAEVVVGPGVVEAVLLGPPPPRARRRTSAGPAGSRCRRAPAHRTPDPDGDECAREARRRCCSLPRGPDRLRCRLFPRLRPGPRRPCGTLSASRFAVRPVSDRPPARSPRRGHHGQAPGGPDEPRLVIAPGRAASGDGADGPRRADERRVGAWGGPAGRGPGPRAARSRAPGPPVAGCRGDAAG